MQTNASYENAPATKLLATHCAVCGRPLVDAKSVELGIGPECRRKHGFNLDVAPGAREEANALVHRAALAQRPEVTLEVATRLRDLGFVKLAEILIDRSAAVRIETDGDTLVVTAPYNEAATSMWRNIPGRRWDKDRKVNVVPAAERNALWALLRAAFSGCSGYGPKGAFAIVSGK